jgi:hypothetical protein
MGDPGASGRGEADLAADVSEVGVDVRANGKLAGRDGQYGHPPTLLMVPRHL